MIKINLLPEEFKKAKEAKRPLEFDLPKFGPRCLKAGAGVLAVLIGLHLLLGMSILFKALSLKGLNAKWSSMHTDRSSVERLSQETASIEREVLPIKRLFAKRILWSRQLNSLSNLMTTGVWLTKLFMATEVRGPQKGEYARVLNLEGTAASLYGDEAGLIARFAKALQEDKDFFGYFSEIKLGPMEKAVLEKSPVMNFKVFCYFKKK